MSIIYSYTKVNKIIQANAHDVPLADLCHLESYVFQIVARCGPFHSRPVSSSHNHQDPQYVCDGRHRGL